MFFCCFKLYLVVHKCGDIYKDDKPITLYQKSSFQTHQDMEQLHYINMLSFCREYLFITLYYIIFILLSFAFMNIIILVSIKINIENE